MTYFLYTCVVISKVITCLDLWFCSYCLSDLKVLTGLQTTLSLFVLSINKKECLCYRNIDLISKENQIEYL